MEICLGMIGMAPSEFWNCSLREINAAIDGFLEFNTPNTPQPMGRDELQSLMERYPD